MQQPCCWQYLHQRAASWGERLGPACTGQLREAGARITLSTYKPLCKPASSGRPPFLHVHVAMELTVKLLAALPARAEGLGSVSSAHSPFRPKFSVQVQLLGPDGLTHIQRTKEFSTKATTSGGGGGAAGGSRPQPLGHQTLTFTLPSSTTCSSRPSSPSGSGSGRSRLGSPDSSFTAGSGGAAANCCEQQYAAERAATKLRFAVLGKLSDMTTGGWRACLQLSHCLCPWHLAWRGRYLSPCCPALLPGLGCCRF